MSRAFLPAFCDCFVDILSKETKLQVNMRNDQYIRLSSRMLDSAAPLKDCKS